MQTTNGGSIILLSILCHFCGSKAILCIDECTVINSGVVYTKPCENPYDHAHQGNFSSLVHEPNLVIFVRRCVKT